MLLFILKVLWDAKSAFRELKGDFALLWPSTPLGKRLGREVADLVFCLVHETGSGQRVYGSVASSVSLEATEHTVQV